jgi:hypothetical protein
MLKLRLPPERVAAGTATFEAQSTCQKSNWIWILDFVGVGQIRLGLFARRNKQMPVAMFYRDRDVDRGKEITCLQAPRRVLREPENRALLK